MYGIHKFFLKSMNNKFSKKQKNKKISMHSLTNNLNARGRHHLKDRYFLVHEKIVQNTKIFYSCILIYVFFSIYIYKMCKILECFRVEYLNMYFLIYIYRGIDFPNHKV